MRGCHDYCAVNDQFVMKAWERSYDGAEHLKFVADGSCEFTKALGLDLDMTAKGIDGRSRRYSPCQRLGSGGGTH